MIVVRFFTWSSKSWCRIASSYVGGDKSLSKNVRYIDAVHASRSFNLFAGVLKTAREQYLITVRRHEAKNLGGIILYWWGLNDKGPGLHPPAIRILLTKVPDFHAKFFLKNNNATKFGEIGLTENKIRANELNNTSLAKNDIDKERLLGPMIKQINLNCDVLFVAFMT